MNISSISALYELAPRTQARRGPLGHFLIGMRRYGGMLLICCADRATGSSGRSTVIATFHTGRVSMR